MTMTSYAQNREDVLLDRLFPRGVSGFYIDVGANDPVANSVTKHFYDLGWRGINVEPALSPFERLREARTRDVNLNIGLSDREDALTFHEFPPGLSGVSTFSAEQAAWHADKGHSSQERQVPVTTLAKICAEHVDGDIDFLTVDVEGHEREVLEGGDWSRWRPRVVVVEATQPATTNPTHLQWEHVLLGNGYAFAAFDGLNRYYVRDEDRHLAAGLAAPVNVTDEFVPYEHAKAFENLRWGYDVLERQLAAARVANETLTAENTAMRGLAHQMSVLRADYERLERAFTAGRAHHEQLRLEIVQTHARWQELQNELAGMHAQLVAAHRLFEGISPTAMAVARRLTQMSTRYPKAGSRIARSLKLAGAVRRRLR
ncbi:MAG: FkbM family methyltransferase [Acidimicrobiales bacterium]